MEITDSWSLYWSYVKAAQQKGPQGFLESLYYLNVIRTNEASPIRQQLLSNYLMTTLLPTISAYFLPQRGPDQHFLFTPVVMQNAVSVIHVLQVIHQLFPQEGEYLLHLSEMARQLVMAERAAGADPAIIATLEAQAAALAPIQSQGYVPPQQLTQVQHLQQQMYRPQLVPSQQPPLPTNRYIPPQQADMIHQTQVPHVMYVQYPMTQYVGSQQSENEERARAEASIQAHKEEVQAMMKRVLNPKQPTEQAFPQLPTGSVVVNENSEQLKILGVQPSIARSCVYYN